MAENPENTPTPKRETVKFDGVAAQINLSPGSDTHRRFAKLMKESGAESSRAFIVAMMDRYESQRTDNSDVIANLEKQIKDLTTHVDRLNAEIGGKEGKIDELEKQLETARNEANENAVNGLGKQAQIDDLRAKFDGAIIVRPNPVSRYFLEEMAGKQQVAPGKILEKLFIDDLQNPRANNLPYTVSASRIREVMEELKGANQ